MTLSIIDGKHSAINSSLTLKLLPKLFNAGAVVDHWTHASSLAAKTSQVGTGGTAGIAALLYVHFHLNTDL
jgi:alkanesulfonate monooxygenase SsuD/methylene tetrahydromethanopterin reductase-like flavin-dependent oxidoreductase (luciferase family)